MADTADFRTLRELVATFPGRGGAPAIIAFGSGSPDTLSYDALYRDIRRVAAGLHRRGIGPGDTVLLWGPNSPAWVAAWFGIVENGSTAIPADDQYRPDDIAAILNHRGAKLVATTASHAAELDEADAVPEIEFVLLDGAESDAQILSLRDLLEQVRTAPAAEAKPSGEAESDLPEVERPNIFLRTLGALLFAMDRLLMRTLFRLRVRGPALLLPGEPRSLPVAAWARPGASFGTPVSR